MPEPNAPAPSKSRRITHRSFCGKSSNETGPRIEGPNQVYICIPCVDLCANFVQRARESGKIPPKGSEKIVPLQYDGG